MSTAQQIRTALEPVVARLGLVVEDVTLSPAGKRRVVRVLVDRDLGGLDPADGTSPVPPLSLDLVADASRAVDRTLEDSDLMGQQAWVLEVSSPGVGRALTTRDQFRRNVGRMVEVRCEGAPAVTGRLLEVDADVARLDVPATKKSPARSVTVDLSAPALKGIVQVEFNRPAGSADAPDGSATDRTAEVAHAAEEED